MEIHPIKTEADYEAALRQIDALMDAAPGTKEEATLEVLATLVEAYEEKKFPIEAPDPIEAIKFRMEQRGLEQKDLARLFHSPARASEILRKRRHLTIEMVRKLNREWQIPLESLVAPYKLTRPKIIARAKGQRRRA